MGFIAAGMTFLADYFIKDHVNSRVLQGSEEVILDENVKLCNEHSREDLLGGLVTADEEAVQNVSALATGGAVVFFLTGLLGRGSKGGKLGSSLLLGGILNNYVERSTKGFVTRYLKIETGDPKSRLVFNLSDLAVIFGAVICFFSFLFRRD